jgi:peptidoglycan/LPS O-acetylase OafA/YrhL
MAAVLVMLAHIPAAQVAGGFGVDIFFVISGFIIAYVTEEDARGFLAKRLFRIAPIYWAASIVLFLIAMAVPSLIHTMPLSWENLARALAFLPVFDRDGNARGILSLGWTIAHEAAFYLTFAVALAISRRYRVVIASALIIAIALVGVIAQPTDQTARFETDPIRLEFIYGMIAFNAWRSWGDARFLWEVRAALLIVAVGTLAYVLRLPIDAPRFIGWGIPAAAVFVCILFGSARMRIPVLLVMIGDASYSLYLFHPYILRWIEPVSALLGIAACIAFALLTWRYIEVPSNTWLRRRFLHRGPAVIQK